MNCQSSSSMEWNEQKKKIANLEALVEELKKDIALKDRMLLEEGHDIEEMKDTIADLEREVSQLKETKTIHEEFIAMLTSPPASLTQMTSPPASSTQEFTIFVEALDGDLEFTTLRVKATTTILNVKEMIEEISTVPVSWLHLSFREVRLNSWKTLGEYNIQDGALLMLNARISEDDL